MKTRRHIFLRLLGVGAMLAAWSARAAEPVKRAPAPTTTTVAAKTAAKTAPAATPPAPAPASAPEPAAEVEEVYVPEKVPAPGSAAAPVTTPAEAGKAAAGKTASGTTAPQGDPKAKPTKTTTSSDVLTKVALMPAPPLSPRFQQVRDRIEALLGHRSETPPKFDPRKNPFRPAGGAPVVLAATGGSAPTSGAKPLAPVAAGSGPVEVPASAANPAATGDLQLLQLATANLKVAGTIQINAVAHLVINQVPYKEGDVIIVRTKGQSVYLRVKNISRYSYTLSLNETELSVKY